MKIYISLFIILITTISFGQKKMKVLEGDIKNLNGINRFDVNFDYTNMQIPKYDSEEAYIEEKVAKYIKKGKEDVSEIFKKNWFDDREKKYEPKFIESFNKRFENGEVSVSKNGEVKYMIEVQTLILQPRRKKTFITAEITVYAKENSDKILFKVIYKEVIGSGAPGYSYYMNYRISESYAKLAKLFAYHINKA